MKRYICDGCYEMQKGERKEGWNHVNLFGESSFLDLCDVCLARLKEIVGQELEAIQKENCDRRPE